MKKLLCFLLSLFSLGGAAYAREARPDVPVVPPPGVRLVVSGAEKPVRLTRLDIRGEIVGRLARTTVEMTFHNPNSRVLEGELQFPLSDGQSISAFALEMENGKLRDAVPVEKAKGRQTFEEIIRQKIDPALLEATQGNNFKMRVYPLNPGKTRRVSLTYTERLTEDGNSREALSYRLPLAYADRVENLSLSLRAPRKTAVSARSKNPLGNVAFAENDGGVVITANKKDFAATGDMLVFSVPVETDGAARSGKKDGKTYFYAELPADLFPAALDRPVPKTLALLWDASASGQKRNHVQELAFLDAFFGRVCDIDVTLQVARDVAGPTRSFAIRKGDWQELRGALESTIYDGATNLGAFDTEAPTDMFFLFSDGLDNYSVRQAGLPRKPLFAFVSLPGCDIARLRGIAGKSGGALVDLTIHDPRSACDAVMKATTHIVEAGGSGVSDVVIARDPVPAVAGILGDRTQPLRVTLMEPDGRRTTREIPLLFRESSESDSVPWIWATMKLAELEANPDLNKGEIRRLGKAFGMATRETSLIVLDRVEDYVRYDIDPPAELKKEYDRLRVQMNGRNGREQNKIARVVREWQERDAWWKKDFPKDTPKRVREEQKLRRMVGGFTAAAPVPAPESSPAMRDALSESAPQSEPAERFAASMAPAPSAVRMRKIENESGLQKEDGISIALRPWIPDSPYIARMKDARDEDLYRIYLDERPDYERSVAFYLDVALRLEERGQKDLALRVFSNLAEMDLENRQILRVLGYRLLQAGQPQQAVVIFKKVLEWGAEEPQSYRDLGLAYEAAGELQKAIDSLYDVVEKSFARNFPGIEVIALTELNAIIARSPEKLDTRGIDPRLMAKRPLDLRVLLTWDTDNTDIDLHVIDPNGDEAFYGHPLSYQGGRVSPDNTEGYGPEEFSLKEAKPGTYRVEVNFYGHRQQIISDSTTIQLDFFTHHGTPEEKKQSVTMRLKDAKDRIAVGEFEVK